jgi:hypothetical protein
VSALDSEREFWIAVVRADEKLTAFMELEVAIRGRGKLA